VAICCSEGFPVRRIKSTGNLSSVIRIVDIDAFVLPHLDHNVRNVGGSTKLSGLRITIVGVPKCLVVVETGSDVLNVSVLKVFFTCLFDLSDQTTRTDT
jgi:hypothetical protein